MARILKITNLKSKITNKSKILSQSEHFREQGCIERLGPLDALHRTRNVVFIAMDNQNPHMT